MVNLPVKIKLSTLETVLDISVPEVFKDSVTKCQGLSYYYEFHRNPFNLYTEKDGLKFKLSGKYGAKVSLCAKCISYRGRPEKCITGRLDLSCGLEEETLRRIELDFSSRILLNRKYQLTSKTNVDYLNTIDPCEVTFLKLDATKIFEKKLMENLSMASKKLDLMISKLELKSEIKKGWDQLNEGNSDKEFWLFIPPSTINKSRPNYLR